MPDKDMYTRLEEVDASATSVTLLSNPQEYREIATDALFLPVEKIEVRSHHNDPTCSDQTPSVSIYFDKG